MTELAFQDDALLTPGPLRDRLLAQMRKSGAKSIRSNLIYGKVRKDGAYDFSAQDELVRAAHEHGLKVQMTLVGTPKYLEGQGLDMGLSYKNADPRLFGEFAKTVAQHFKGRVGRYSLWNEPNISTFLDSKDRALSYRRLYQEGRAKIKGIDGGAQVMLGELSPGRVTGGDADVTQGLTFLKEVLRRGNKPLRSEGFALHPYQWGSPNREVEDENYLGITNLDAATRALLEAKRRGRFQTSQGGAVPLYLTEFSPGKGPNQSTRMNRHTRAAWLAKSRRLAEEAGAKQFLQYQLAPSHEKDYWDTSIADRQGNIYREYIRALSRR